MTPPEAAATGRPLMLRADALVFMQAALRQAAKQADFFGNGRNWHNGAIAIRPSVPTADADSHGTIGLSERYAATINNAFATAGQPRSPEQLDEERLAFSAVLHEFCHLQTTQPESWAEQMVNYNDAEHPAYATIEEGVTDLFVIREFATFARDTGLDKVCPGITDSHAQSCYPHLVVPTWELLTRLGEASNTDPDELLGRFNSVSVTNKWLIAADTLTDTDHRLDDLPQDRVDQIRFRVAARMMEHFERLGTTKDGYVPENDRTRRDIVREAVEAGKAETDRLGQWANAVNNPHDWGAVEDPFEHQSYGEDQSYGERHDPLGGLAPPQPGTGSGDPVVTKPRSSAPPRRRRWPGQEV